MQFLKTVQESVWGKAFYEKVRGESAGQAMKYFLLLMVSVSIITSLVLVAMVSAAWKSTPRFSEIEQTIISLYPDELVLTWKNGEVSSNVDEPYAIAFPKEWRSHDNRKRGEDFFGKNLLVIDTSKSIDPADFDRYETLLILGKDSVGSRDNQKGKVQIQNFSHYNFEDFSVNKQTVALLIHQVFRFLKWALIALFLVLPLLIFMGLMIKYLVYLVFGALIIWLIAKLRKVELTYGMAYKLGLYLITLPILVNILSNIIHIFDAPFVFTLLLAIVTYFNLEPPITTTPTPKAPTTEPTENPTSKDPVLLSTPPVTPPNSVSEPLPTSKT